MERDSGRTFREIHGGEEALVAHMERIEQFLVKEPENNQDLPLRFITPYDPPPQNSDPGAVHLRLTPLGEFDTSADYVAVSYTWIQPADLGATLGVSVPDYIVWTSETAPRRLRCPALVLHRALCFASDQLKNPLVWIDQECIKQDDRTDLEAHVHNMHKVYTRSTYTIAVLPCAVTDRYLLDGLRIIQSYKPFGDLGFLDKRPWMMFDVGSFVSKDVWFTRTWAFQERYCSKDLIYLVPVSHELNDSLRGVTQHKIKCDGMRAPRTSALLDIAISARHYSDLHARTRRYLVRNMPDLKWGRGSHHGAKNLLRHHVKVTPDALDLGHKLFIVKVFKLMELCENLIVADRLAILSNVCGFSWRLKDSELDRVDVSYSTCILALMKHNGGLRHLGFPKKERSWGKGEASRMNAAIAKKVLDVSISDMDFSDMVKYRR